MGYYINLRCSECGYSFTGGYSITGISSNLGLPIVVCPKCNLPNKTGKKIWSQMSSFERGKYVFGRIVQTLINALALSLLIILLIVFLVDSNNDIEAIYIFIGSVVSGILLSSIITIFNSQRIIKKLEKKYKDGNTAFVTI